MVMSGLLGELGAVTGGLAADDEVVVAGQTRRLDGDQVLVLR